MIKNSPQPTFSSGLGAYPQVTFPSVIPPAVIYIRPRWGRREYLVQVVYLVSIR